VCLRLRRLPNFSAKGCCSSPSVLGRCGWRCKKDHWDCKIIAQRMKSELLEPPNNMLFVDARGKWLASCSMRRESGGLCIDLLMALRPFQLNNHAIIYLLS